MNESSNTSQAFRVVCPPGCRHSEAARMHQHEAEIDIDGTLEVSHEVDFGEWTFGNVIQHVDGPPDEKHVTVSQVEPDGGFTDPAALRRFAADLMNAADWLASVQDATT